MSLLIRPEAGLWELPGTLAREGERLTRFRCWEGLGRRMDGQGELRVCQVSQERKGAPGRGRGWLKRRESGQHALSLDTAS